MAHNYIWYASYGSNLNTERFYCYIYGTRYFLSSKTQTGCRSKNLPLKEDIIKIPYEVYFSKSAESWENKGVAFLKSTKNQNAKTIAKMYLIERHQFIDIFLQENNKNPFEVNLEIDFSQLNYQKELLISPDDDYIWYGRLIYLTEHQDYPAYTFTAKWRDDEIKYTKPGDNYLKTIIKGIKDSFNFKPSEIIDYLLSIDGIKNNFKKNEIENLIL